MAFYKHVPPQLPLPGPTTKIAFVGEAPSDDEVITGQPLVGPSGRVFNQILRSAGLERADYLVTNVYDEQAEDNDLTEFMKDEALTKANFERLESELRAASPNVIVPMGASALWAFTGHTAITPFRGTVAKATRIIPGAKLLPTFHPAFVMRQWKFLPIVVGDIIKAAAEAERGPKVVYPQRKLYIEPDLDDFRAFSDKCKASDLLSVDIETGWGQITCIGFAPSAKEAMCVPFVDHRKPNQSYWATQAAEVEAWKITRDLLEHPVPKLGQNFTYDAFWLLNKQGVRVRNYQHDTRLMHHALHPELPKDLAFLGGTYTDLGAWKHWGGRYSNDKRDS